MDQRDFEETYNSLQSCLSHKDATIKDLEKISKDFDDGVIPNTARKYGLSTEAFLRKYFRDYVEIINGRVNGTDALFTGDFAYLRDLAVRTDPKKGNRGRGAPGRQYRGIPAPSGGTRRQQAYQPGPRRQSPTNSVSSGSSSRRYGQSRTDYGRRSPTVSVHSDFYYGNNDGYDRESVRDYDRESVRGYDAYPQRNLRVYVEPDDVSGYREEDIEPDPMPAVVRIPPRPAAASQNLFREHELVDNYIAAPAKSEIELCIENFLSQANEVPKQPPPIRYTYSALLTTAVNLTRQKPRSRPRRPIFEAKSRIEYFAEIIYEIAKLNTYGVVDFYDALAILMYNLKSELFEEECLINLMEALPDLFTVSTRLRPNKTPCVVVEIKGQIEREGLKKALSKIMPVVPMDPNIPVEQSTTVKCVQYKRATYDFAVKFSDFEPYERALQSKLLELEPVPVSSVWPQKVCLYCPTENSNDRFRVQVMNHLNPFEVGVDVIDAGAMQRVAIADLYELPSGIVFMPRVAVPARMLSDKYNLKFLVDENAVLRNYQTTDIRRIIVAKPKKADLPEFCDTVSINVVFDE